MVNKKGQTMKQLTLFSILILIFTACSLSQQSKEENFPPKESELSHVPNCAADGEGCQQFNPNL